MAPAGPVQPFVAPYIKNYRPRQKNSYPTVSLVKKTHSGATYIFTYEISIYLDRYTLDIEFNLSLTGMVGFIHFIFLASGNMIFWDIFFCKILNEPNTNPYWNEFSIS